jgi:methionine sulfoxide reductase heme-binding subunit
MPTPSTQPATRSSDRMERTLGTGRDWRRRVLFHHLPLALASALALVLFIALTPSRREGISIPQLSTPTGYVATVLLALTLLIGPINLLLRRRNPVSTYLRRDLGTWTAVFSVVHVIVSLQGHGGVVDFFIRDGRPLIDSFGLGNWTGLAATVIVGGLLVISTDRAMRELKGKRWKDLQRLNYTLFVLVILHAVFYGALSRMTSPLTILLIFTVIAVFLGQTAGIWLWRRKRLETAARRRPVDERQPRNLRP